MVFMGKKHDLMKITFISHEQFVPENNSQIKTKLGTHIYSLLCENHMQTPAVTYHGWKLCLLSLRDVNKLVLPHVDVTHCQQCKKNTLPKANLTEIKAL